MGGGGDGDLESTWAQRVERVTIKKKSARWAHDFFCGGRSELFAVGAANCKIFSLSDGRSERSFNIEYVGEEKLLQSCRISFLLALQTEPNK